MLGFHSKQSPYAHGIWSVTIKTIRFPPACFVCDLLNRNCENLLYMWKQELYVTHSTFTSHFSNCRHTLTHRQSVPHTSTWLTFQLYTSKVLSGTYEYRAKNALNKMFDKQQTKLQHICSQFLLRMLALNGVSHVSGYSSYCHSLMNNSEMCN